MPTTKISICLEKEEIGKDMFLIRYKTGRTIKFMGVCKGDEDYTIAQQLQQGMQFVVEMQKRMLKPVREFQIKEGFYDIPRITKIITR